MKHGRRLKERDYTEQAFLFVQLIQQLKLKRAKLGQHDRTEELSYEPWKMVLFPTVAGRK